MNEQFASMIARVKSWHLARGYRQFAAVFIACFAVLADSQIIHAQTGKGFRPPPQPLRPPAQTFRPAAPRVGPPIPPAGRAPYPRRTYVAPALTRNPIKVAPNPIKLNPPAVKRILEKSKYEAVTRLASSAPSVRAQLLNAAYTRPAVSVQGMRPPSVDITGRQVIAAAKKRQVADLKRKCAAQILARKKAAEARAGRFGELAGYFHARKPGPLTDNQARTFAGARYHEVILDEDTILFRAGYATVPDGQYLSADTPKGIIQARTEKAIPPEWPDGAKSPIDSAFSVRIPKGTKIYVGTAGYQNGFYLGGTEQIFVSKPWEIPGYDNKYISPLK